MKPRYRIYFSPTSAPNPRHFQMFSPAYGVSHYMVPLRDSLDLGWIPNSAHNVPWFVCHKDGTFYSY